MKHWKKILSLLLAFVLALSLSACTIPTAEFADYDVSGYIKALLDSSYYGENEELMKLASVTLEEAQRYNTTTVENAAVIFFNTYEISPSEQQLEEMKTIMQQALSLTKYTVKEERKVENGYYLEVEIAPIVNFVGRSAEIERMKEDARQEATEVNNSQSPFFSGDYGDDSDRVNANDLFVDKVLEFCKKELANISYAPSTCTVALDIHRTDDGELQLDMDQIEVIDRTVLRFEK